MNKLEKILINYFGSKESLYRRFPSYSWNGTSKQYTRNCTNCDYYKKIEDVGFCFFGKAWKVLNEVDHPRKCQYV